MYKLNVNYVFPVKNGKTELSGIVQSPSIPKISMLRL